MGAARLLGDLALLALLLGLMYLFLANNGFIGHSDIQPYPTDSAWSRRAAGIAGPLRAGRAVPGPPARR